MARDVPEGSDALQPIRVEYSLAEKGEALAPVIEASERWSHRRFELGPTQPSTRPLKPRLILIAYAEYTEHTGRVVMGVAASHIGNRRTGRTDRLTTGFYARLGRARALRYNATFMVMALV
jgi:hypothetical protein